MSSYSGSTTITFTVERHMRDGVPVPVAEGLGENAEIVTLDLTITGRASFQPGMMHGPPENCYPDEGEIEIEAVTFKGRPFDGLTEDEEEAARQEIDKAVREAAEEDGPDYDDLDLD